LITIISHEKRVRGLPHIGERQFTDAKGALRTEKCATPGLVTTFRPTIRTECPESVLEAYLEHPEIKSLLERGSLSGFEIVAVDGKACAHEDVLVALYGDKLPSKEARLQVVADELTAEMKRQAAVSSNIPEEILPANMPITTPESSSPDAPVPGTLAAALAAK
jgi:hypothetical protein